MTEFTITEDFPKNEIEFDARFSTPTDYYLDLASNRS